MSGDIYMRGNDYKHLNKGGFRETIEYLADCKNEYSKEELHAAFLTVTRLYLDELINARQLENLFINRFGEEASNEFFEAVAGSNDTISEADDIIGNEIDPVAAIKMQFDIIEKLKSES